jgi:hypothetical protein
MFRQVSVTFRTSLQKVLITNSQIKIYPNPSSGKIFVQSDEGINKIKIYQVNGQLIAEYNNYSNDTGIVIYDTGLYTLVIENENGAYVQRISIIR